MLDAGCLVSIVSNQEQIIMVRRIWVAEGYASDGDVYGRSLQLPGKDTVAASLSNGTERKKATVLKTDLGDIPTCPCISAVMPLEQDKKEVSDA